MNPPDDGAGGATGTGGTGGAAITAGAGSSAITCIDRSTWVNPSDPEDGGCKGAAGATTGGVTGTATGIDAEDPPRDASSMRRSASVSPCAVFTSG